MIAAFAGGMIGGGINLASQLYHLQPTSLAQALRCVHWGEVGISFAAGAVAGLTGFGVFGGLTALFGSGLLANITAGAVSGMVAGQNGRITTLALSGNLSSAGSVLFRPQDLMLDAALGGVGGAAGYGLQRGTAGIAEDLLQSMTRSANRKLAANPQLAQAVLHRGEYLAAQSTPAIARMQYGNAVERMVAQRVEHTPFNYFFEYVGGPSNPDFIGKGIFSGITFDITSNSPRSIASHLTRSYGDGLILLTYVRPSNFRVFP